jgi:hypothetical protein
MSPEYKKRIRLDNVLVIPKAPTGIVRSLQPNDRSDLVVIIGAHLCLPGGEPRQPAASSGARLTMVSRSRDPLIVALLDATCYAGLIKDFGKNERALLARFFYDNLVSALPKQPLVGVDFYEISG